MGKISISDSKRVRHDPLYKTISTQGGNLRTQPRKTTKRRSSEVADEEFIDAASSRKILQLAKDQQEELELEENQLAKGPSIFEAEDSEEEAESSDEGEYSDFEVEEEYFEEDDEDVDPEQAAMFEAYFKTQSSNSFGSFNLADKVMAKLQEKEDAKKLQAQAPQRSEEGVMLPPKVIAVFTKVAETLRLYRHGKLPKLFKAIPTLRNWKDVLFVTNPEGWSNQAVYEATKLFVSNLKPKDAQYFIENVLLPKFRDNIEQDENHKLNYHVYRSLKKSLYKPSAFFKGFLYPLVEEGCTQREAVIAASVLQKNSIPALHSSAALDWLLSQDYAPATTVFIRVLLEKKYALPFQVIDNLVAYFMRFRIVDQNEMMVDDGKKAKAAPLPLVWQKAFLAFAQRYKNDITEDQRDFLLEAVRQRGHKDVGPEIRRELLAGENRVPLQERQNRDEIMLNAF